MIYLYQISDIFLSNSYCHFYFSNDWFLKNKHTLDCDGSLPDLKKNAMNYIELC